MPKYTINKNGRTVKFNSDRALSESELSEAVSQYFGGGKFTPDTMPRPLTPQPALASTTETIASSPFAKQYSQQAAGERGDIAKNVISFGLPFLATGLSAGAAIPAAGALAATGEALGTKVGDVIAGRRTSNEDVVSSSIGAGVGALAGEGIGRGAIGMLSKIKAPFKTGYMPDADKLAKGYGLELPASAVTSNRAVPLLESLAGKSAFGNKLTQMTLKAEDDVVKIGKEFTERIGASTDPTSAGIKSAEGLKAFENTFRQSKDELYNIAKIQKGDVRINPKNTVKVIDDIIENITNSANPNSAELKYFQQLRKGLYGGDPAESFLASKFPPQVLEAMKKQGKIGAASGVDGTTVLNTIKNLNRKTNFNSTDPIATGYQAELRKIGATLSNEFDNALATSKPEIAEALARANTAYKTGISKLNSEYGKKIKELADAGQYDKIANAVLNKSTSIDDIPRIFEVVGEEGRKALKANLADAMLGETKRNAKGVYTPAGLDRTLKEFGDARLKAIYTPEEFKALKDISKLNYYIGSAQKVSEGSQSVFLAKMSGIVALAVTNPPLALQFILSDASFAKIIASKSGQQLLRSGFPVSQTTRDVVPSVTRMIGQSLGQN